MAPPLACNGIRVEDLRGHGIGVQSLWQGRGFTLGSPWVSVFDPDGHLPLLLQRTGLATSKFPFHESLLDDVIKDLISFILVNAPQGPIAQPTFVGSYSNLYPGFAYSENKWLPLFCLSHGTSIVDPWFLRAKGVPTDDRVLLVPTLRHLSKSLNEKSMNLPEFIIPFNASDGPQDSRAWFRAVMGGYPDTYNFGAGMGLERGGGRILIQEKTLRAFRRPGLISQFYWSRINEEFRNDGWVILRTGDCQRSGLNFERLAKEASPNMEGIAELYLTKSQPEVRDLSPIARAWKDLVGAPIIPFGLKERRRKLQRAFDVLKNYVAAHENLMKKEKKTRDGG